MPSIEGSGVQMRTGIRSYAAATLAGIILAIASTTAEAASDNRIASKGQVRYLSYTNIGNNSGGHVINYALQTLKWKKSGRKIRFSGRCASACTLYLGLPAENMCISPGASFHFHAPYGASARGNRIARSYMLRTYPGWVRAWLNRNGGLNSRLVAMNYSYASRFIKSCATLTAQSN